jgi:hypothetical protein
MKTNEVIMKVEHEIVNFIGLEFDKKLKGEVERLHTFFDSSMIEFSYNSEFFFKKIVKTSGFIMN